MNYEGIITVLIAIIGWFIVYHFEKRRDHLNKRRDLHLQYLISAYRNLESASNRELTSTTASELESAVADIQLFGTANQVRLARGFATSFAQAGKASLDELLEELRRDLRAELQLDEVPRAMKFLRVDSGKGRRK